MRRRTQKRSISKKKYTLTNQIWFHLHSPIKIVMLVSLRLITCCMLERGMMVANKLGIGATNGKGMGIVVIKAAENTEKDG